MGQERGIRASGRGEEPGSPPLPAPWQPSPACQGTHQAQAGSQQDHPHGQPHRERGWPHSRRWHLGVLPHSFLVDPACGGGGQGLGDPQELPPRLISVLLTQSHSRGVGGGAARGGAAFHCGAGWASLWGWGAQWCQGAGRGSIWGSMRRQGSGQGSIRGSVYSRPSIWGSVCSQGSSQGSLSCLAFPELQQLHDPRRVLEPTDLLVGQHEPAHMVGAEIHPQHIGCQGGQAHSRGGLPRPAVGTGAGPCRAPHVPQRSATPFRFPFRLRGRCLSRQRDVTRHLAAACRRRDFREGPPGAW